MEDNKIIDDNCWVAYCDILGFKEKITKFEKHGIGHLHIFVKNYFKKIEDELKFQRDLFSDDVCYTWFSDSIIFFALDDSKESFRKIHSKLNTFCWGTISGMWPLRAAIGHGQLYADISKNLFLGSGIINAYEYAEQQNWIGSIVTPEANNRLNELGDDLSGWKGTFVKYPVPFRLQKERSKTFQLELFVSKIHHLRPDVKRAVQLMRQESINNESYKEEYEIKYKNTLNFFEENP